MKICKKCKIAFNLTQFYISYKGVSGPIYSPTCKACDKIRTTNRHKNNPGKQYEYTIKYKYGLKQTTYDQMLCNQDSKCAICRKPESRHRRGKISRLCVDHCHKTGVVRKLLCYRCNYILGMVQEDPKILMNAAQYLQESITSN